MIIYFFSLFKLFDNNFNLFLFNLNFLDMQVLFNIKRY